MNKRIGMVIRIAFFVLFIVLMVIKLPQIWLAIYALGVLTAPLFGRLYCGYVCPMGTLMKPVQKLSRKLGIQRKNVPSWTFSFVLPSIILVITVIAMIVGKRATGNQIPIIPILTVLSVIVTVWMPSPFWHNALCPFSVPLRLMSKRPLYAKHVDHAVCEGAKKCVRVCPSGAISVNPEINKATIDSSICHQCEMCTTVCPTHAIATKKRS